MTDGDIIRHFAGDHAFLSNVFPSETAYEGVIYPTAEHAYQAAKTEAPAGRKMIKGLDSPGKAKRAGLKVTIRPGWDGIKLGIMKQVVRDKFQRHPDLRDRLVATGSAPLVEENDWGDTYWGVSAGGGANHLGRILMAVRAALAKDD